MRAERLVSLLMLLQARGRLSAPALARELGVSERTVYRDVEALCAAGVPIFGLAGAGGGYALVDTYRTTLTGMTAGEARALLLLHVPAPLESLGVTEELRSALRKLAAALPLSSPDEGERVRRRVHLDAAWWAEGEEPAPHLRRLYDAALADRRVVIAHKMPGGGSVEYAVEPLGLVAKAGVWYLVYARRGTVQARRVGQLLGARDEGTVFTRPAGFDLAAFWEGWCEEERRRRQAYRATLRVAPGAHHTLAWQLGVAAEGLVASGPPDAAGWTCFELAFESLEAARAAVLACGGSVEVLAPEPLRRSVWDYAEQILRRYSRSEAER